LLEITTGGSATTAEPVQRTGVARSASRPESAVPLATTQLPLPTPPPSTSTSTSSSAVSKSLTLPSTLPSRFTAAA